MTNTLYVYCPEPSPRIRYVFEFTRVQWNLKDLIFLDQATLSGTTPGLLINYSNDQISQASIQIIPCTITEPGSTLIPAHVDWLDGLPFFFKTNDSVQSLQAFDVPGMIFFMLSRMEEYNNPGLDSLRRVEGKASFASKNNFLHLPVVDLWLDRLAKICSLQQPSRLPGFHLTIDIDIAWAFAHRPLWENLGGAFKEILSMKWKKLKARWGVWTNVKKDPFEVYDYLMEVQKQHNSIRYFILMGDRTKLDRSFYWKNPSFVALIKKISAYSKIGIHPSSQTFRSLPKLVKEKQRLESILAHEIQDSRHHYLLIELPQTYRDLLEAGIKNDFTMGFHDLPGFRAGTTQPFYWYDLDHEIITDLKVHPFFVMDVTLKNYLNLSSSEALDWIKKQKIQFEQWCLPMTIVWHNSSFFESDGWKGWKEVLEILFPIEAK